MHRLLALTLAAAAALPLVLPPAACAAPAGPPADALPVGLFEYDRSAPLDVQEVSVRTEGAAEIHDISYASPKGGRVPAYLVVPAGAKGPFAGLILMHGMPGSRETTLKFATKLARTGAVSLLISSPFARRGAAPQEMITFTEKDRDEQIQLMVDLRRGVDLLTARADVDPKRLGYVGGSYGGAMGALFAGIEPRVKTFVLAVADGGLVSHVRATPPPGGVNDEIAQWMKVMEPIEPIRFVGRAAPGSIFLQSARNDQFVPVSSAEALHKAVAKPGRVQWYDTNHFLSDQAKLDQVEWLASHVGIDASKFGS